MIWEINYIFADTNKVHEGRFIYLPKYLTNFLI